MGQRIALVLLATLFATTTACGGSANEAEQPQAEAVTKRTAANDESGENARLAAKFKQEYAQNYCPPDLPELQVSWCGTLKSVTYDPAAESVTLDTELHPDDEGRMFAERMCPSVWGLVNANDSPYTVQTVYIYSNGEPFELCANPLR